MVATNSLVMVDKSEAVTVLEVVVERRDEESPPARLCRAAKPKSRKIVEQRRGIATQEFTIERACRISKPRISHPAS